MVAYVLARKALVSIDFEGLPFIVNPKHLSPEGRLWNEARRVATRIARVVAEALLDNGFDEVIVADAHGPMINIEPDELPEKVYVAAGIPRAAPLMVPLVDRYDVALFIGYHARAGVRSSLAHTYAGRYIRRLLVNGREMSEFSLNAMILGERGVPVGLVAGSEELLPEVEELTPWAIRVSLKKSLGYMAGLSPSIKHVEKVLRSAVGEMVVKLEKGELKPLTPSKPVSVEVELTSPLYAEIAELHNGVRVDYSRLAVTYVSEDMLSAVKTLELLLYAWIGASSLAR